MSIDKFSVEIFEQCTALITRVKEISSFFFSRDVSASASSLKKLSESRSTFIGAFLKYFNRVLSFCRCWNKSVLGCCSAYLSYLWTSKRSLTHIHWGGREIKGDILGSKEHSGAGTEL
jgi:hypothetical protein